MSMMEQPDMSKPHDIVVNPLDGDKVQLLCSCLWTFQGNKPFVEALINRHLGSNGLAVIAK